MVIEGSMEFDECRKTLIGDFFRALAIEHDIADEREFRLAEFFA